MGGVKKTKRPRSQIQRVLVQPCLVQVSRTDKTTEYLSARTWSDAWALAAECMTSLYVTGVAVHPEVWEDRTVLI